MESKLLSMEARRRIRTIDSVCRLVSVLKEPAGMLVSRLPYCPGMGRV